MTIRRYATKPIRVAMQRNELQMPNTTTEEDPRQRFHTVVLERMESGKIEARLLSQLTQIPDNRLLQIVNGKPGAALFSDLIALAFFFEISIDRFFT
jgi:hypothetical protein